MKPAGRPWGSSKAPGTGQRRKVALTLKGWRWATEQGHRIPCELHGVKACATCMDPARVVDRGAR